MNKYGMEKTTLLIMAAGLGSRYGGLKQLDSIDGEGNKIIDYSVYDASRAGFDKVIFIINEKNEADFRAAIGDKLSGHIEVDYAFQSLNDIPKDFTVPENREKPWGTAQAVLSARDKLDTPFAVINADDFYGKEAFEKIHGFLTEHAAKDAHSYAMVSFILKNTLTENGYVSRGICSADSEGYLRSITERTHIERDGSGAKYTEDGGESWVSLTGGEPVSMNIWGFPLAFMDELSFAFKDFLKKLGKDNDPVKAECYLPQVVDGLIQDNKAKVSMLSSSDTWFGVTYKEDKENVVASIKALKEKGVYPERLW